jgi:hypothetical protein
MQLWSYRLSTAIDRHPAVDNTFMLCKPCFRQGTTIAFNPFFNISKLACCQNSYIAMT